MAKLMKIIHNYCVQNYPRNYLGLYKITPCRNDLVLYKITPPHVSDRQTRAMVMCRMAGG